MIEHHCLHNLICLCTEVIYLNILNYNYIVNTFNACFKLLKVSYFYISSIFKMFIDVVIYSFIFSVLDPKFFLLPISN